ncbi:hypothetical protein FRB98_000590 [Tulasnella sp. 332]|nr:hypothetical protein FRB98_000590 [Tulasnella sp. 332]
MDRQSRNHRRVSNATAEESRTSYSPSQSTATPRQSRYVDWDIPSPDNSSLPALSPSGWSTATSFQTASSPESGGLSSPPYAGVRQLGHSRPRYMDTLITFEDFKLAGKRPTTVELIRAALQECPGQRGNSKQICSLIQAQYPEFYYDETTIKTLKANVRQRLTNRPCFVKLDERAPGVGSGGRYWMYNDLETPETAADQARATDHRGVPYPAAPADTLPEALYVGRRSYLPLPNFQTTQTAQSPSEPPTPFIPPAITQARSSSSNANSPAVCSRAARRVDLNSQGHLVQLLPPNHAARPTTHGWTTFGALGLQEQLEMVSPPAMPFAPATAWQDVTPFQQSIDFNWSTESEGPPSSPSVYMEGMYNFAGYGPAPTWPS